MPPLAFGHGGGGEFSGDNKQQPKNRMKPIQLIENKVRVQFYYANTQKTRVETFDLCDNEQRREMGRQCAIHQSFAGNRITSEVISAVPLP